MSATKQSQELTGFYREYKSWVKTADNEHIIFDAGYDLFDNLKKYCRYGNAISGEYIYSKVCKELKEQLAAEGLNIVKPFGEVYSHIHFNSKVIKWINDHA